MIEVIYKEEKKKPTGNEEFFRIPRNIRQIGENSGNHKIYLEDYVYTFLVKVSEQAKEEGKVTILLGHSNWQEGTAYTFIKGAVLAENMDAAQEKVAFTDEIWKALEEKEKEYFCDLEVVGWSFALGDLPMKVSESIRRAHVNYFGGNEKVLFFMEPLEKEEAFFQYENGRMIRQDGYYIYYEKNPQMQEYMLGLEGKFAAGAQEEVEDKAVTAFRKIIGGKGEEKVEEGEIQRKSPMLMYAASACLAVSVLAVGVSYLNNYDEMKQAAETVKEASALPNEGKQQEKNKEEKEEKEEPFREEEAAAAEEIEQKMQDENKISREKDTGKDKEEFEDTPDDGQKDSGETIHRGNSSFAPNPLEETQGTMEETKGREKENSAEPSGKEADHREEGNPAPIPRERKKAGEEKKDLAAKTGAKASQSYEVQFGDSLYKISTEKYGDMSMIQKICELNGISTEDLIYPGQIILLP